MADGVCVRTRIDHVLQFRRRREARVITPPRNQFGSQARSAYDERHGLGDRRLPADLERIEECHMAFRVAIETRGHAEEPAEG
jgi:hypothetical protein